MRTITFIFDELGNCEVEAFNFKGKACEQKMQAFIEALGVPTSSKKKPEFFQEDRLQTHN